MSEPILSGDADAVGGGVRIPAEFKPAWATSDHEEWLASTAYWEDSREPVLVGASMAIGRPAFEAVGGFNESLMHGEDTLLSYMIVAAGLRLVLRHDIIVDHHLLPSRYSRRGFAEQAVRRAEWHAFEVVHWERRRLRFPHLCWIRARWRLARLRGRQPHSLADSSLTGAEMRLMQEIAFWPAYLRRRGEPECFDRRGARLAFANERRSSEAK